MNQQEDGINKGLAGGGKTPDLFTKELFRKMIFTYRGFCAEDCCVITHTILLNETRVQGRWIYGYAVGIAHNGTLIKSFDDGKTYLCKNETGGIGIEIVTDRKRHLKPYCGDIVKFECCEVSPIGRIDKVEKTGTLLYDKNERKFVIEGENFRVNADIHAPIIDVIGTKFDCE